MGLSALASQIPKPRAVRARDAPAWGFCVHTSGTGIVDQAKSQGSDPFDHAVAYYTRAAYYAHYVIGYEGQIAQIADENERAEHVGFSERGQFLDGSWESALPASLVRTWHERWPKHKSPAHLFPGPSPNSVYVGCELIPLARPNEDGTRYTVKQVRALAELVLDWGHRSHLPEGWWYTPRLVGHEDLNPLTRSSRGAGWDPGIMRPVPWLKWGELCRMLDVAWLPSS